MLLRLRWPPVRTANVELAVPFAPRRGTALTGRLRMRARTPWEKNWKIGYLLWYWMFLSTTARTEAVVYNGLLNSGASPKAMPTGG
jgi:hypothetical protein